MKKRRIKKGPIVILFLIIIVGIAVVLFLNKFNVLNGKKSDSNSNKTVTKTKEVSKEKSKDNYYLREGEELIKKTKTNMHLTKYQGAYYVDGVMIVNKSYPLDSTYKPSDPYKEITSDYLYGPDYLDKTVMEKFLSMKASAKDAGYELKISSGYRSYKVQVDLYNNYAARDGKEAADTYSARAGYSEHQSGLCFDLNGTNKDFLETDTGKWVNEHAAEYGFILRFPKDKEGETGYNYEAWHFRYVGEELAKKLYDNGNWISLESYLGVDSKYEK